MLPVPEVRVLRGREEFRALHDYFGFNEEVTEPMPLGPEVIDLRPAAASPSVESDEEAARRLR